MAKCIIELERIYNIKKGNNQNSKSNYLTSEQISGNVQIVSRLIKRAEQKSQEQLAKELGGSRGKNYPLIAKELGISVSTTNNNYYLLSLKCTIEVYRYVRYGLTSTGIDIMRSLKRNK